jgi:hypothetical protein
MPFFGVASDTITGSAVGSVIVNGVYSGFDTSSYAAGDRLYVSNTVGQLTDTRPSGSTEPQVAAIALDSANPGNIFVMGRVDSNSLPNLTQGSVWVGGLHQQKLP